MAFAKVLSRNDDHRAREIDSDCRVKWCWGWLEKEITLNYGGTDLATTVGEFYRKIESCGIARCVLCDDNTRYGRRGCQALVEHIKTNRHCRNVFNKRSHQEIPHAFFAAHSSANDDEGRLYGINPIYIGGDTAGAGPEVEAPRHQKLTPLSHRKTQQEVRLSTKCGE